MGSLFGGIAILISVLALCFIVCGIVSALVDILEALFPTKEPPRPLSVDGKRQFSSRGHCPNEKCRHLDVHHFLSQKSDLIERICEKCGTTWREY